MVSHQKRNNSRLQTQETCNTQEILGHGLCGRVISKPGNVSKVKKEFYNANDYEKECSIISKLFERISSNPDKAIRTKQKAIIDRFTLLLPVNCKQQNSIDYKKCYGITLGDITPDKRTLDIFKSVRESVLNVYSVLHYYRIYHCDMHSKNLMICKENNEQICKVIDFGEAQDFYGTTKLGHDVGSLGEDSPIVDLERNDLTSLKCILHVCNDPIFKKQNDKLFPKWIDLSRDDTDEVEDRNENYNSAHTILKLLENNSSSKNGGCQKYNPTLRTTPKKIIGIENRKIWIDNLNQEFVKIKKNGKYVFKPI